MKINVALATYAEDTGEVAETIVVKPLRSKLKKRRYKPMPSNQITHEHEGDEHPDLPIIK
jgi:hypothetical protein